MVFIDYDGTLHDSDAIYDAKLDGALGMKGIKFWQTYVSLHREVVHSQYPEHHDDLLFHLRLLFKHLGRPYNERTAGDIASRLEQAQKECWERPLFFPDALQFLDGAKVREYRLCLATGDYAAEKAQAVEEAAGRKYFEYAFDWTHLGLKGAGEYFQKALAITRTRSEEGVVIGDSLAHDIEAASGVGMTTIWLNRLGLVAKGVKPDFEVQNLLDALTCL